MSANRRLAAIMVADVVGYSRLMEADEAGTLAVLKERRTAILQPTVRAHGGRIVKIMGDGVLIEFASAVNAVAGAIELQGKMAEANADVPEARHIVLRIGINLGDVIGEGSDIYGDGVNIAARLEALAEPGGICISGKVHEEVRGKVDHAFEGMGEIELKNIDRPVRAYRLGTGNGQMNALRAAAPAAKPSIAVLPFANMSGDADQQYFSDGITEDIITELSRIGWLFVTARNSSFIYKGRSVDVREVGRELGVRYVLEGSVRKSSNRMRITGQLIDVDSGAHLWADRFDGALEDIFDLQDQVTARVVGALAPKLEFAEIERAQRKPTESLDAYDYFLRGMASHHRWDGPGNDEALRQFYLAIDHDENYAPAYGMAARCFVQSKAIGLFQGRADQIAEAERLARKAGFLGKNDAVAMWTAGFTLAYVVGDLTTGDAFIQRALDLTPSMSLAWAASGWVKVWLGEPEIGLEREARSMSLTLNDTQSFSKHGAAGLAHFCAGRYDEALLCAEASVRDQPNFVSAMAIAAASAALAGRPERAADMILKLKRVPGFDLSSLRTHYSFARAEDRQRWIDALRKAGLPE